MIKLMTLFLIASQTPDSVHGRLPRLLVLEETQFYYKETVRSAIGQAGQRQTRDQLRTEAGIEQPRRVDNRLETRVPARLRSRIDRQFIPVASASAQVTAAQNQARKPQ